LPIPSIPITSHEIAGPFWSINEFSDLLERAASAASS